MLKKTISQLEEELKKKQEEHEATTKGFYRLHGLLEDIRRVFDKERFNRSEVTKHESLPNLVRELYAIAYKDQGAMQPERNHIADLKEIALVLAKDPRLEKEEVQRPDVIEERRRIPREF